MQFTLQALPLSRHAQNDALFGNPPSATTALRNIPQLPLACIAPSMRKRPVAAPLPLCEPTIPSTVRILRSECSPQSGRLLISGRMADVCAALNRLAFNEYACG